MHVDALHRTVWAWTHVVVAGRPTDPQSEFQRIHFCNIYNQSLFSCTVSRWPNFDKVNSNTLLVLSIDAWHTCDVFCIQINGDDLARARSRKCGRIAHGNDTADGTDANARLLQ